MDGFSSDVVIVGGGLAGLACARLLYRAGFRVLVLEADNDAGGRIRTDSVEGFLLDRGFQVLHTAYPEAQSALDLSALRLKPFDPGIIVRKNGRFHFLADPLRKPGMLFQSIFSPVGTFTDKLRVLALFARLNRRSLTSIFAATDLPTRRYLQESGFSADIVSTFFRPFFGAVCLDPAIGASRRVFDYIFQMFASGDVAVPEKGMGQIPRQVAAALPADAIKTGTRVSALSENGVRLADGREISADAIVLATPAREVQRLLNETETVTYFSEHCLYFAADRPPMPYNMLILNGEGRGPITNLAMLSQASPAYAPQGKALLAAVVIGKRENDDGTLLESVRAQLRQWFGPSVDAWRHLKTYFIPNALPDQSPPLPDPHTSRSRIKHSIYACGEYGSVPGTQWALHTGRKTAESIIAEKS
mgnify:CR=1 FL=1